MSFYDYVLTKPELKALKRHTHDLADEIDVLRVIIRRELSEDGDGDTDKVIAIALAIAKIEQTRNRAQTKPDDVLKLALLTALNALDSEET